MIEKEQNFFEYAYDLFYKFAQTKPEDVGVIFSRDEQYPIIKFVPEPDITIPLPKKQGENYIFEGMVFENSDNGRKNLWCLFLATLYHMAAHAGKSVYSTYDQWRQNRTDDFCWRIIDFIEDAIGENYILSREPEVLKNIENINSKLLYLQKTLVETHKKSSKNKSKSYPLDDIETKIKNIKKDIVKKNVGDEGYKENILSIADFLYKNRELLPKTILPYCEHHEYRQELKFELNCPEFEPHGIFEEKIAKLDELWQLNEQTRARIFRRFRKYIKKLHFDTVVIPSGNLHSYASLKVKTAPLLRTIRQQIRMITNLTDNPRLGEMGYVDMQMAIQAIASEGQSTDIFEIDERRRGEEAWVILVDKSASMSLRFDWVKEFTVCMAECANDLTGKHDAWALYTFDNNFQILKDFKERYNQEVKARIGDMSGGGLSLLPDAIELSNRLLNEDPREKKYLFIITDGHAAGYEQIHQILSKMVKKLEMSDTSLIAIGVTKKSKGTFSNVIKATNLKTLVGKFITAYKTVATSDA